MESNPLPQFDINDKFAYTAPPNPGWTYGQKADSSQEGKVWANKGESAGWKVYDISKEDPRDMYKLMISGIVPRPIAFVSSISAEGVENLAPFSWFNMVSHNPAVVSISCTNLPTRLKDTAANIRATQGFTVSIISKAFAQNANCCSMDAPPDVDEWSFCGLTKEPSISVKASRPKESAFSMECELLQAIDIPAPKTGKAMNTLILGTVKHIHVRRDVLTEKDTVDPALLKPISRMGDITYATIGSGFRIPRPAWEHEGERVLAILKN